MDKFTVNKASSFVFRDMIFPSVLFLILLLLFFNGLGILDDKTNQEQIKATKDAITRAAVHCYALEGFYPSNIEYLENNYGLNIDHDRYIIDYIGFASNLMPDITVLPAQ